MAKIVVALLVLTLSTLGFACKACGYSGNTHYPAYSKQLQEVINTASQRTKIKVSKNDVVVINKIIYRENRTGNLGLLYNGCFGLGQGKRQTYKSCKVPWMTKCPVQQVVMILRYVKGRYKTFSRAWAHHLKHHWY